MVHSSPISLIPNVGNRDDQVTLSKRHRLIGQLLAQSAGLQPQDIDAVLQQQREHGGRFAEIALAMGLVTEKDVMEALAKQFDFPFVSTFGDEAINAELVCACDPLGEDAQSFRDLRTELLTGVLDRSFPRALAILSPRRGDGRSYVAANLAVAFAQLGGRTLLVDANMRAPRQHTLFGVSDGVGLSQLLCGRASTEEAVQPSLLPGLFVIGAGPRPPNPLELLLGGRLPDLIQEWLAKFDYVVIDTPPASEGTESRILADRAGAALVVARPHSSRMKDLDRLVSAVEKGHAALAGVVMNEH
jgi:protein-tyrosine kinase